MTKKIVFPMAVILGAFVGLSSPALAGKGGGGGGGQGASTHTSTATTAKPTPTSAKKGGWNRVNN
jgi:hypothetical protein